ncbi:MAG TPA: hypothetical protein VFZ11_15015 [Gemmatimonadaceae bacterium]
MTTALRSLRRHSSLVAPFVAALAIACASSPGADPAPQPEAAGQGVTGTPDQPWPVKTRYVADLWLHGYAMLLQDTSRIPLFARGYRDRMVVRKNQSNITTMLDANREQLARRLETTAALQNSQFLSLYFGTWDQLKDAIALFQRAEGEPRRASNQQSAQLIAFLAANFPTAADREWLRLFTVSLEDEGEKFYQSYWTQTQRERSAVVTAVDSLWQRVYRPRFQGYLNNSRQAGGDFYLSLPLDGEGRTVRQSERTNVVAVAFPERADSAVTAIYVFAHEVSGEVTSLAVRDNLTPAEVRMGAGTKLEAAALVRGGEMLLARLAPELAEGYARYYLRSAGLDASASDPRAALAAAFPLPDTIRDAIERQIEITMGGI